MSGIGAIVTAIVATGPTIDRIIIRTMVGPTIIGPTITIRDGAEVSMQMNDCCNASLANLSHLAGNCR
jgi:hypothetical protein